MHLLLTIYVFLYLILSLVLTGNMVSDTSDMPIGLICLAFVMALVVLGLFMFGLPALFYGLWLVLP